MSRGQRGGTLTAVYLSFQYRSRYYFFQVAPNLSSRGWVNPLPDTLLLRKMAAPAIEPGTSRAADRNSDH
jgi:hypothetical protein